MKILVKLMAVMSIILMLESCQKECYYEYNIINNFDRPIAYKGYIDSPHCLGTKDTTCYLEKGDTLIVFAVHILGAKGENIEHIIRLRDIQLGTLLFDDSLAIQYDYSDNYIKNFYRNYESTNSFDRQTKNKNLSEQKAYYKVDNIDYQNALQQNQR